MYADTFRGRGEDDVLQNGLKYASLSLPPSPTTYKHVLNLELCLYMRCIIAYLSKTFKVTKKHVEVLNLLKMEISVSLKHIIAEEKRNANRDKNN